MIHLAADYHILSKTQTAGFGAPTVMLGSENAGRAVSQITSDSESVAAGQACDVCIVRQLDRPDFLEG